MKILLVAATSAEISILTEHFQLAEAEFMQTEKFDILITGVGMTATAFALGKHLSNRYNLVLNLGIAGSFDPDIPLGTVLNVTADDLSELGAENKGTFLSIEELGFGKSSFKANNNLLHTS
jgi:futalosine hydrolase